jgi:thermopsin
MDLKKLIVISIAMMSVIGFSMAVVGSTPAVQNAASNNSTGAIGTQFTSSGGQNASAISQFHSFENSLNSTASSKVSGSNQSAVGIPDSSLGTNASSNLKNSLFLPNYKAAQDYKMVDGHVSPKYITAPAPMGIGDFGLKNVSGILTPYQLSTNSFEGTISISNLTALYALNDDPSNITIQLNTVLNNVTLFGSPTYSFWTQNVLLYSSSHHTIQFEDNLWNFSSSKAFLTSNAIYQSTGRVIPYPGVHIAYGPSFAVKTPFTVHLYLNSTLIDNRNAVYFNYSVPQLSVHGTYDLVIFNSTYNNPTYKTPQANFLISGTHVTPTGYLLYDAEIMIGGPGGGSTTTLYNVNANMTLKYHNSTTKSYMNVPSAYDYGTDTGETSSGESIYWNSNDVAEINTGPSILQGMWGIQPSSKMGDMKITGQIKPSNAFLFVNVGTRVNNLTAQWAPVQQNGNFMLFLTPGTYSMQVLLSNYAPVYEQSISGAAGSSVKLKSVMLTFNDSYCGYTPLYAFNNNQLSNISVHGHGTASEPYILAEQCEVDSVFGHLNDFGFPVFMAVFLSRTTDYVTSLSNFQPCVLQSDNGTFISYDTMPFAFYRAQNYSMICMYISGNFYPGVDGFFAGEITFWDSSNDIVSITGFNTLYPVTAVNSTDITISNSRSTMEYNNVYLICGSVTLANDVICCGNLTEINGTANLVNSKIFDTFMLVEDGASVNLRGSILAYDTIVVIDSTVNTVDDIAEDNSLLFVLSSLNSVNDNSVDQLICLMSSQSNIQKGKYLEITMRSVNSTASFTGTTLNNTCIVNYKSSLTLTDASIYEQRICSVYGAVDISGSSIIEQYFTTVYGSSIISNSQLYLAIGSTCIGNLTISGTMITGFEYGSIFSNNTVTNSYIQSLPTSCCEGYEYPTHIWTYAGNNVFSGDTFAIAHFQNTEDTLIYDYEENINSITFLDGMNSVTGSTFMTIGGDSSANLIIEYGINNIQHDTFESKHVSLPGNQYGAGSSLIVYGGVNVIGSNKFISINSQATSQIIKYGDVSTQTSNEYYYSVNFTESSLPLGTNWTVSIGGSTYSTNASYIDLLMTPGNYAYTAAAYGYGSLSGSVNVVSSSVNEPLTFSKLPQYSVTFMSSGLPVGVEWNVTMDHMTMSGYGSTITFVNIPKGTYTYTVSDSNSHYSPASTTGTVVVSSNMTQTVSFKGVTYTVIFNENGLSSGTNWTVTVNGHVYSSNGKSSITLSMPIGSNLTYKVSNETGYISSVRTGNFPVFGNYSVTVNYAKPGVSPTLTYVGIAVAAIAGLAVGAGIMLVLRKKTTP